MPRRRMAVGGAPEPGTAGVGDPDVDAPGVRGTFGRRRARFGPTVRSLLGGSAAAARGRTRYLRYPAAPCGNSRRIWRRRGVVRASCLAASCPATAPARAGTTRRSDAWCSSARRSHPRSCTTRSIAGSRRGPAAAPRPLSLRPPPLAPPKVGSFSVGGSGKCQKGAKVPFRSSVHQGGLVPKREVGMRTRVVVCRW